MSVCIWVKVAEMYSEEREELLQFDPKAENWSYKSRCNPRVMRKLGKVGESKGGYELACVDQA